MEISIRISTLKRQKNFLAVANPNIPFCHQLHIIYQINIELLYKLCLSVMTGTFDSAWAAWLFQRKQILLVLSNHPHSLLLHNFCYSSRKSSKYCGMHYSHLHSNKILLKGNLRCNAPWIIINALKIYKNLSNEFKTILC